MNIALLGLKTDFENKMGAGPTRYIYELSKRLNRYNKSKKMKISINSTKVPKILGSGTSFTGNSIAFALNNLIKNFNKYDIVHTFYPNLIFSPLKNKTQILSTAFDMRGLNHRNYYCLHF